MNDVVMILFIFAVCVYGLIVFLMQERIHKIRPPQGITAEGVTWMLLGVMPTRSHNPSIFVMAALWPIYLIAVGLTWAVFGFLWCLLVLICLIAIMLTGGWPPNF